MLNLTSLNMPSSNISFVINKCPATNYKTHFYGLDKYKLFKNSDKFKEQEEALWRLKNGLRLDFKQLKLLMNLGDTALRKCIDEYFEATGQTCRSGKKISVSGQDFQKFFDENCVN